MGKVDPEFPYRFAKVIGHLTTKVIYLEYLK
jgi:hypothetical protein